MFCHLTLQGRPAPKREPEVDLTSSQSCLSSSIPLVKWWWWGDTDSQSETWVKLILSVPAFICLLRRVFFFFKRTAGPALSGRGKQRSGIGWARLMPSVKWCWHAEGLLWEVVIHHDFRMTQKQHSAFGVMVWDPWLMWGACVCRREWERDCVCLCAEHE